MNKQFTASEVRGQIAWLRDVTVVGTKATYQMLDAFADLLEAQERAVPVVTRESAINAIEHIGRYNGPDRETEARQMLVEGSPSVAHRAQAQPPAASVTDAMQELADKYHELLWAVARKFPGETRHETALRYIREAECQEAALAAKENPNVLGEFSAKGKLPERTYLAANTPTLYDGYYPPYFNVTAISGTSGRLHQVELTVRQPTLQDLPPGETTVVVVAERNTALDWKEFVKCVNEADKKFDTIDYSDSCF